MANGSKIAKSFARNRRALALRPSIGHCTAVSRVRLVDGLACEIQEGPWTLRADMDKGAAGAGSGPTPGVFGRAALGSCLAITYLMWAEHLGVPLTSLEVEVEADFDSGAFFGTSDASPAYSEVRYVVILESEAPQEDIDRLVEEAEAHCAYRAIFEEPMKMRREVRVRRGGQGNQPLSEDPPRKSRS